MADPCRRCCRIDPRQRAFGIGHHPDAPRAGRQPPFTIADRERKRFDDFALEDIARTELHSILASYPERLMCQRAICRLPGSKSTMNVASRSNARILCGLHHHGRTLAEGTVEQQALAG